MTFVSGHSSIVCVFMRAEYRWHGRNNLLLTLRQLQRTALLVFPKEVEKNGETPMCFLFAIFSRKLSSTRWTSVSRLHNTDTAVIVILGFLLLAVL